MKNSYIIQAIYKTGIFYVFFDSSNIPSFVSNKSQATVFDSQVLGRGWISYAESKAPNYKYSLITYQAI